MRALDPSESMNTLRARANQKSTSVSVILEGDYIDERSTGRHPAGHDAGARELRLTAYIAIEEAKRGQGSPIQASAAALARVFKGATLGGMKRSGMGERALERARAAWLEGACIDCGNGLVRLRRQRGKRFYSWPIEVLERVVYGASNTALRAFFASARGLSGAAGRGHTEVAVRSRAASARSGQGRTRWCRAARELRILGVIDDNRPATLEPRLVDTPSGPAMRLPVRKVKLSSAAVPLRAAAIVWPGEARGSRAQAVENRAQAVENTEAPPAIPVEFGPAESDPEQIAPAHLPLVGELVSGESCPRPVGGAGKAGEVRGEAPRVVSDGGASSDGEASEPAHVAASSSSRSSGASSQRRADSPSRRLKLRPGEVRAVLREFGVVGARDASETACLHIARAVGSVAVLRRVLEACGESLRRHASFGASYLARACQVEGAKVRRDGWVPYCARPGVNTAVGRPLYRARDAEVRDMADAVSEAGLGPARLRELAAARRAAGDWDAEEVASELEARAAALEARRARELEAREAAAREAARWAGVDRDSAEWLGAVERARASCAALDTWWDWQAWGARWAAGGVEVLADNGALEVAASWAPALARELGRPVLAGGVVYQPASSSSSSPAVASEASSEAPRVDVRGWDVLRPGSGRAASQALLERLRKGGAK